MKHQIKITGMHCNGCTNLIKLSLEEANLNNVVVSLENNNAEFETELPSEAVKVLLDNVFEELKGYKYFNVVLSNVDLPDLY